MLQKKVTVLPLVKRPSFTVSVLVTLYPPFTRSGGEPQSVSQNTFDLYHVYTVVFKNKRRKQKSFTEKFILRTAGNSDLIL